VYRVWYSTETFADYVIENTSLNNLNPLKTKLCESDASKPVNFHRMPDHIKKILYLDSPDLIVEREGEPVFSVEISQEAGTGHDAFQRFPRIAAAVENGVPALYIFPEAIFVRRKSNAKGKYDVVNPNIFAALESAMKIFDIPALLFYFPSLYPNPPQKGEHPKGLLLDPQYSGCPLYANSEMQAMFDIINLIIERAERRTSRVRLINERLIKERREWMQREFFRKGGGTDHVWSPESATIEVPTVSLVKYLRQFDPDCEPELILQRERTIIYQADAKFRGDPYTGALAGLDYLKCRVGKTYEDRDKNLAMAWGKVTEIDGNLVISASAGEESSVSKFIEKVINVRTDGNKCLLGKTFGELRGYNIPRYFMQARYGCTFTKVKEIRCYAYFADAILFYDGAFWREG
jgi:hypothetical protein